jgi:D-arginine dehydrogenase
VLLERESQPGYHATGRSAAVFSERYGPSSVRALTRASRDFFNHPPAGFAESPLISRRGLLTVAELHQETLLDSEWYLLNAQAPQVLRLNASDVLSHVPVLRGDKIHGAIYDPDVCDLDVHILHQGFLRGIRSQSGSVHTDAEVTTISRSGAMWRVEFGKSSIETPVIINAAGAWCDEVAKLANVAPIGLVPKRRTAFTFNAPAGVDCRDWPMTLGIDESWYFKPDAGALLGSPANADPMPPQDAQPEELDIATGMYMIEEMTTLRCRPNNAWAGLRSFVDDGSPVIGFDPTATGFFWLAGQGGYGIQTAPALGRMTARLASREPLGTDLTDFGVEEQSLSPRRIRKVTFPSP